MATETLVQTSRSTGNMNRDRLVRDVANRIALLDPEAAPLTSLMIRAKRKSRKVSNPMFEMLELRRPSETTTAAAGVAATTSATTITVASDDVFMQFDLVMDEETLEVMLITAAPSGNVLTVSRAVGGDIGAITSADRLTRIGNAQAEGSDKPNLLSRNVEIPYNYIQIQRRNWALTQTAQDSANYGEKDRQTRNRENSIEHQVDLEKQFLFGQRDISTATTFPRRMSGGVFWFLGQSGSGAATSTSVGTLTLAAIDLWAESLFLYDQSPKVVFCGARALSAFTTVGRAGGQINLLPGGRKFGLQIRQFITAHGVLNLVYHRLLARLTTFTGLALALTMKNVRLAYQGAQRTELKRNQQGNGIHGREDGLISAQGFELVLPETHGYMSDITG